MILDTIDHIGSYRGISPYLDCAIAAIEAGIHLNREVGRVEIDGENVFLSVQRPVYRESSSWERHERYIDIQISLSGDEACGWAPAKAVLGWEAYDAVADICFAHGENTGLTLSLQQGWFVIFFPQDAHMPCLRGALENTGYKVVYKVRI